MTEDDILEFNRSFLATVNTRPYFELTALGVDAVTLQTIWGLLKKQKITQLQTSIQQQEAILQQQQEELNNLGLK